MISMPPTGCSLAFDNGILVSRGRSVHPATACGRHHLGWIRRQGSWPGHSWGVLGWFQSQKVQNVWFWNYLKHMKWFISNVKARGFPFFSNARSDVDKSGNFQTLLFCFQASLLNEREMWMLRFPGAWRWGRHSIFTVSVSRMTELWEEVSCSCNLCEGGIPDPLHQQVLRIYSHKSQKGSTCKFRWFIARFDMLRQSATGTDSVFRSARCVFPERWGLIYATTAIVLRRLHSEPTLDSAVGPPKGDPKIMPSTVVHLSFLMFSWLFQCRLHLLLYIIMCVLHKLMYTYMWIYIYIYGSRP